MIIGRDISLFLKNFLSKGGHQSFLLAGEIADLEDLLIHHLVCEKKIFCKKCASCESDFIFDIKRYEDDTLKIEDAREIQFSANQSSFAGGAKIFLLKNNYIAPDAQATLLKTFEEPHPATYFILSGVPESSLSRPLLSRLAIFKRFVKGEQENFSGSKFSLQDIQELSGDREKTEETFRKLEYWVDEKIRKMKPENLKGLVSFLEDLYESKKRFFEKTYSPRMLLEHILISKYYIE